MTTTTTTADPSIDAARLRRRCRTLLELAIAFAGASRPVHAGEFDQVAAESLPGLVARIRHGLHEGFDRSLASYAAACEALQVEVLDRQ